MCYFLMNCYWPPPDLAKTDPVGFLSYPSRAGLGAILEADNVIKDTESWIGGKSIEAKVPEPIRVLLEEPGDFMEMFEAEFLLMTEKLVAAIRDFGAQNLQLEFGSDSCL